MYECPICGRKRYVQGVCLDCLYGYKRGGLKWKFKILSS